MDEPRVPKPLTAMQWLGYLVLIPSSLTLLIFWPAGSLRWGPGWLFVAVLLSATVVSAMVLWRFNPVIFAARSRIQHGTAKWDRILLAIMLPLFVAIPAVAALDAGRMHWAPQPAWAIVVGYCALLAGIGLLTWSQVVNRFFEPGVRIQSERGHRVIDSGPYAIVRHPGYVGAIALFFGMALALGSLTALVPAVLTTAVLVLRAAWEDAMLQTSLPGYADYAKRVRSRLAPGIW